MSIILEGLNAHDLDFLIMPLVSIDEYESKINDRKAIVVGFFVTEKEPADSLAGFIEKGNTEVLDVEVSPAPTEDGYYLVFVEMSRDENFIDRLMGLVDAIENLTNVEKWEFSPYHSKEDENYKLDRENLENQVNLDPESIEIRDDEEEDEEATESIGEVLSDGIFESAVLDGSTITLRDRGNSLSYGIVMIGSEQPSIPLLVPKIGDPILHECSRLQSMLGRSYEVYPTDGAMLVIGPNGYTVLSPIG